jgi:hypothetical protein
VDDGRLRLDNNWCERELRRQAVGRKNWLFVASDDGAKWNAVVVSLIASCELHTWRRSSKSAAFRSRRARSFGAPRTDDEAPSSREPRATSDADT